MSLPSTSEITETKTEAASLVRELGTIDAAMIVVGSMIGSGIFITSAESARYVGAPGWLLVAWGLAGLMTITGSLCAAEIAAMMPRAGGQYVFLREAYSPMFGFLFGWAMFLVVQTGTIAAVAVAFAKFLGVFFPEIAADHYVDRADPARGLRRQPLVATTRGPRADRVSDPGQHAGPATRQMDSEYVHVHQDGRADRPDRGRPALGQQLRERGLDVVVVGFDRQRLGSSRPDSGSSARGTDWLFRSCSAWR